MFVQRQRRRLLTLLGVTAAAPALSWRAVAQARHPTLGWLSVAPHPFIEAFRAGMSELGWREGETYAFDFAYGDGDPARLPRLAAGLVQSRVAAIVASGSHAVDVARKATLSLPIVAVSSGEALGSSLARPVGNVTGIRLRFDEVAVKWLELLVETAPTAMHIAVVCDNGPSNRDQLATVQATAKALGRTILPLVIAVAVEIAPALERAQHAGAQALIFVSSPIFTANAALIAELVQKTRLPAMFESRVMVRRGGLLSFGPDLNASFRRLASFADRILKGAKPAELPVEQPTKFEFAINLKTAKSLGIEIPAALQVRADEVIE
jgi:putative ABC transport system substrate-binding protein